MLRIKISVGPEVQILSGVYQPFMYMSEKGTLVVNGHFPYPPGYPVPEKNQLGIPVFVRSWDKGVSWKTWKPDKEQGIGPIIEGATVQLNDGTIRTYEFVADISDVEGEFIGKIWDTKDEWRTLTGPKPCYVVLPESKTGYDDGGQPYSGITFHRSIIKMPDGNFLACIYCWFKGDDTPVSYEPKMMKFRSVLIRSRDEGIHWEYVSTIAVDDDNTTQEGFNEPVMIRLSQGRRAGRLLCLIRTGKRISPIYQIHSDDEGKTWQNLHPTNLCGVDPDVIEMKNEILACSYGYRLMEPLDAPEHGNYVAFSRDQGETWENITRLPIEPYPGGVLRSTCYTGIREIEPNKLIVVYDIGYFKDIPVRYLATRFVDVKIS